MIKFNVLDRQHRAYSTSTRDKIYSSTQNVLNGGKGANGKWQMSKWRNGEREKGKSVRGRGGVGEWEWLDYFILLVFSSQ